MKAPSEMTKQNFVVGGRFDDETPRSSGVATKLAEHLGADPINGGSLEDLSNIDLSGRKLVVWMPDLDNGTDKIYPHKDQGSTLICSKVMRTGYTSADAIARIFKMHANAVIEVYPTDKPFNFRLLDALGNEWSPKSSDLSALAEGILRLHKWTQGSIRVRTVRKETTSTIAPAELLTLELLSELNREVADRIEATEVGRYFGNTSTRCASLFPSHRDGNQPLTGPFGGLPWEVSIYVSARNLDKRRITAEDFVLASRDTMGPLYYEGERKPSVDTPVQLALYFAFPEVNFMIHGHAFIRAKPTTPEYFPCGDKREFNHADKIMKYLGNTGAFNLKKHGFLLYSDTLQGLRKLAENSEFYRKMPT